ncbi:MAG TPA: hypothetical protein VD971_12010 [Phycisphaerales bacterium]|nr:hypothetical protein [Phycisphaerales bacterium]
MRGLLLVAAASGAAFGSITPTPIGDLGAPVELSAGGGALVTASHYWSAGGGAVSTDGFAATRLSADGSTAVGTLSNAPGRWTPAVGFHPLPAAPGYVLSAPRGVSADGSVVLVTANDGSGGRAALYSTGEGTLHVTPAINHPLTSIRPVGLDLSADGTTIGASGLAASNVSNLAQYRYTQAGGWAEGSVIGSSAGGNLGPGTMADSGAAFATNGRSNFGYDGCVLLSRPGAGDVEIFGQNPMEIGAIAIYGVSLGGDRVAGFSDCVECALRTQWVWSAGSGETEAFAFLAGNGADFSGWSNLSLSAMAPNGVTFAGTGTLAGSRQTWIVTIPAPGAFALLAAAGLAVRRRR